MSAEVNECIIKFLRNAEPGKFFPATDLYNEGWMLRLLLDWFHRNPNVTHECGFDNGATWYSEALLPSAFPPSVGNNLGESRTHADGVIGHIDIEDETKAGLILTGEASQFVVIEAKIFSSLSERVTNASYFDQAARTVACMAEVVKRAPISPSVLKNIAFYVVAPKLKISDGVFSVSMDRNHMQSTVKRRHDEYKGERDEWFNECFLPTFQKTKVDVISWETILAFILRENAADGKALKAFYKKCLEFNKPAVQNGKPA